MLLKGIQVSNMQEEPSKRRKIKVVSQGSSGYHESLRLDVWQEPDPTGTT